MGSATPRSGGPGPEFRQDPLSGAWVIIAPVRSRRPRADDAKPRPAPEYVRDCPLCPGNEHLTPPPVLTLPGRAQQWAVRVVPNLYPAVIEAGGPSRTDAHFLRRRTASGVHEVVVDTPSHKRELPDRTEDETGLLLAALQQRLGALEARPATRYVAVFKNRGAAAGSSLPHPHSQIVALDSVPGEVRRRVRAARTYWRQHGGCLLCALVAEERRAGERIVFERDGFVALAPYASSAAGEMLLVPLGHAPSLASEPEECLQRSARGLIMMLAACRQALGDPPYNLLLYTAPKRMAGDPALHWYWRLLPRLARIAGLELGTGLHVNPLAPEEAAGLLRSSLG